MKIFFFLFLFFFFWKAIKIAGSAQKKNRVGRVRRNTVIYFFRPYCSDKIIFILSDR